MTDRNLHGHCLAVIAYRGGKCLHVAHSSFAEHDFAGGKTPLKILGHLCALFDWALSLAEGAERWPNGTLGDWDGELVRFHASLSALENNLASERPVKAELTRLLQGPIADALTHVGQLTMLRRISGSPIVGENYYLADIAMGRLGPN
jgi:hypothetical protein